MSVKSVDKKKLRAEIKNALARLRREKAASIEKDVDNTIEPAKIISKISAELERIKNQAFSTANSELAYEWLVHYGNERLKHENKLISRIKKELKDLRKKFLKRELSVREFKEALGSLKRELAESEEALKLFQELHTESLEKLKKFRRIPSFVSAQHKRTPSRWLEMIRERFADFFLEEKIEHLRALEKELIITYRLTESELKRAMQKAGRFSKEPLLTLPELEKKAMRSLCLADKLSQGIDFFWERLRALELVAEIRKNIKKRAQKLAKPETKKIRKAEKPVKEKKKKQKRLAGKKAGRPKKVRKSKMKKPSKRAKQKIKQTAKHKKKRQKPRRKSKVNKRKK